MRLCTVSQRQVGSHLPKPPYRCSREPSLSLAEPSHVGSCTSPSLQRVTK